MRLALVVKAHVHDQTPSYDIGFRDIGRDAQGKERTDGTYRDDGVYGASLVPLLPRDPGLMYNTGSRDADDG